MTPYSDIWDKKAYLRLRSSIVRVLAAGYSISIAYMGVLDEASEIIKLYGQTGYTIGKPTNRDFIAVGMDEYAKEQD
jgi:hypothetical protein